MREGENMSIEQEINYEFSNKELLQVALSHTSYANEHRGQVSNERTEYLGDAVLELISSEYIFKNYSNLTEGEMTKARAFAVCESSLVKVASKYHFEKYLKIGKCEINGPRPSMLADSVEAVIGAIFLDSGFDKAKEFILPNIIPFIEEFVKAGNKDYKTKLQEKLQVNGDVKIEYKLLAEHGEDHEKSFDVAVYCNGKLLGKGKGKSKKEAEMDAAKIALK